MPSLRRMCSVALVLIAAAALSRSQPLERPYTGEPDYAAMKKVWPRQGGEWTALCPPASPLKFIVLWNGTVRGGFLVDGVIAHQAFAARGNHDLVLSFGLGDPPVFEAMDTNQTRQRLMNGYLPCLETVWRQGDIEATQRVFTTLLDAPRVVTGSETVVALVRVTLRNLRDDPAEAVLSIRLGSGAPLALEGDQLKDAKGRTRLRVVPAADMALALVKQPAPGAPPDLPEFMEHHLRCAAPLPPQGVSEIVLQIPYFFADAAEADLLKTLDFDAALRAVTDDWERTLQRGMTLETPDADVNAMFRAQVFRLLTSGDKDPLTGKDYFKTVPTARLMIATDALALNALDLFGHPDVVGRYLDDSYVAWQGNDLPDGDFISHKGYFSGPPPLEGFRWPVKNGFVLWALCEHYLLTRDGVWADRVLPSILKSCDWIKLERNRTKKTDAAGRKAANYGLLPKHRVADWTPLATNGLWTESWNYVALRQAGAVLAALGHPRAEEIAREACDYRECIRDAVRRSIARAARITLPNGDVIPFVPPDIHSTQPRDPADAVYGQENAGWGPWIEYADCGPLWMVFAGVFDAREDEITWLLRFAEEYPVRLLYPGLPERSPLIRYSVTFGFPTLYDPEVDAYLGRDESVKVVENFYSKMANLSWRTYMGRTHRAPAGDWHGPLGEAQVGRLLRRMLLDEEGDVIRLARCLPKAWREDGQTVRIANAPTHFGPMGMEITSAAARGRITARVIPPVRNPTPGLRLLLRLRHPDDKPLKTVTLGGKAWKDFRGDTITLPPSLTEPITIEARY